MKSIKSLEQIVKSKLSKDRKVAITYTRTQKENRNEGNSKRVVGKD